MWPSGTPKGKKSGAKHLHKCDQMYLKLSHALKDVICSAVEKLFPDSLGYVSNQYT